MGLPSSTFNTQWVSVCLSAGGIKDYAEQNRSTLSIPLAILAQACQHLWPAQITTFINSSHMLRIPSFLAPLRVDAPRVEVLSRVSLLA